MITVIKLGNEEPIVMPSKEAIGKMKEIMDAGFGIWGPYIDVQYIAETVDELRVITGYYRARNLSK